MVRLITLLVVAAMQCAFSQEHSREWWERLYAFRALHQEVGIDYLGQGIPPPSSLEKFESMRATAGIGKKHLSPHGIKAINSFVIVPGNFLIGKASGIPDEFVGKRLYILSRFPTHDSAPSGADLSEPLSGGRRAILISEVDLTTDIPWISEPTAQLLLRQFEGFDPAEQPLAFISEAAAGGISVEQLMKPDKQNKFSKNVDLVNIKADKPIPWFIVILAALILFCVFIIFKIRSNKGKNN